MANALLTLRSATVSLGGTQLFEGLDAALHKGERVCLVGRNGSGKSSLLKVLAGQLEPDRGERVPGPRVTTAYLPQEPVLPAGLTLREHVLGGLPALQRDETHAHLADQALAALGMDPERGTEGLSGGETRRVSIARALVAEPDILLLDEPTNHLDLDAIAWLEEQLKGFRGALAMVSHDRRFLTEVSNRIWWLDRGRLHVHEKGYADFEPWSAALLESEEKQMQRLEKHIQLEEHWLHRGVTARRKRNQGRLRKLASLRQARIDHIKRQGTARLGADTAAGGGALVIEAKNIVKRFPAPGGMRTVVDGFSTRIMKGDRIGIVGANGAGKTTLVKMLAGEIEPDSGSVRLGTGLVMARFEQDRGSLDLDATPWSTLCPDGGDQVQLGNSHRHVVGYLRDFLFREDQARQPVRTLSGGERNRLLLARILARPSNLLILDEPTNDLDIETLDLLEEVLADYDGTLLLVSHDRDFLDRVVTSTILVEGEGRIYEYAGGYSDLAAQHRPGGVEAPQAPRPDGTKKAAGRQDREASKEIARRRRELERLPGRIDEATAGIRRLETELSDPALFTRDHARFEALGRQLDEARAQLEALEERWLELEMELGDAADG